MWKFAEENPIIFLLILIVVAGFIDDTIARVAALCR